MDRKKTVEHLKRFKARVEREYQVEKMYLFGSRARGKPDTDSDFDLIIVSPKFRKLTFFQRGARMYDYWNLRYPVDFLCYTPEEFKKLSRQTSIVSVALKEGKEI